MATTVHLPAALLERVDKRARRLKLSRNQYIRRALERMIEGETAWSDRFLEALRQAEQDTDSHAVIDEMMYGIARRSRKRPPKL
jgi:predicted transcriptional regulator